MLFISHSMSDYKSNINQTQANIRYRFTGGAVEINRLVAAKEIVRSILKCHQVGEHCVCD